MTKSELIRSLGRMTRAYLEAALWATMDNSTPQGGESLEENYGVDDFTVEALEDAEKDCKNFYEDNEKDLVESGESLERMGHDLFLSRNGHGAGFFDRGNGGVWSRLQKAAKVWGASEPYVGDSGKLYWGG